MVVAARSGWCRGVPALIAIVAVVGVALSACSGPSQSTVAGPPLESGPRSVAVAATTTTDEPTTTAAPTTTMTPTTDAPTTTEAPTTTAAPTTTTTLPPLPPSPAIEPIDPSPVPLVAVGTNSGAETARVQQRLLDLGFWLEAADGQYGLTTRQAVMAFQKYLGFEATGSLDETSAAYLSNMGEQAYGRADAGTLVEIDKGRQLLFVVVDGRTQWVFNTSTGSEIPYVEVNQQDPTKTEEGDSVTPVGLHNVNRERPVGWWEGDLGRIYRPKYFVGGVAVHGSSSVPNYPASHGCVRVTVEAMDFIWNAGLMPMDLPVWVHT